METFTFTSNSLGPICLAHEVEEMEKKGYVPQGGVAIAHTGSTLVFAQAMVNDPKFSIQNHLMLEQQRKQG